MVGGTFGNNQQSLTMMSVPEPKCEDMQTFLAGGCQPCPRGSQTINGQCDFCD